MLQVKKTISSENVNQELTYFEKDVFESRPTSPRNTGTPLHLAVRSGHVRVVEYLLQVGADVDKKDSLDRTPMDVAVLKDVSYTYGRHRNYLYVGNCNYPNID